MKKWSKQAETLVWALWSGLTIVQTALSPFVYSQTANPALRCVGWMVWGVMCVLVIVPIFTLRRKGDVAEGSDYTRTVVLVDSGIYAIVRHPQYLAFMLLNLFLVLVDQHPLITIVGIPAMALSYLIALRADEHCLQKFGDDYGRYMQVVPRVNLLVGLVRLLRRRSKEQTAA